MVGKASAVNGSGLDYFVCDVDDDTGDDKKSRTVRTLQTIQNLLHNPTIVLYTYMYTVTAMINVCVHT